MTPTCKEFDLSRHEFNRPTIHDLAEAAGGLPIVPKVTHASWIALLVAATPTSAYGHGAVLVAPLFGAAENPPNSSLGFGLAVISIDFDLFTMRFQVSYGGLDGAATAANLYGLTALPGEGSAMPAIAAPSLPGFPLGATSGTYDQTFDLAAAATYEPAFMAAHGGNVDLASSSLIDGIFAGKTYFDVHSTAYENGEICSFLLVSPESDFTRNGRVDAADLNLWRHAFFADAAGDANADVRTDGADFLIWQRQLSRIATLAGPHSHGTAAPEPSGAALISGAVLTLAMRCRRCRGPNENQSPILRGNRLHGRTSSAMMTTAESLLGACCLSNRVDHCCVSTRSREGLPFARLRRGTSQPRHRGRGAT